LRRRLIPQVPQVPQVPVVPTAVVVVVAGNSFPENGERPYPAPGPSTTAYRFRIPAGSTLPDGATLPLTQNDYPTPGRIYAETPFRSFI
jgi:hypothetical protein